MLPFCYEAGLASGHAGDAPHFMVIATETFIKEVLSTILSRTRSNGPGENGSIGFGAGTSWIRTHKYKKQLAREEEACQRGELTRDKCGLLPVEAKMASERGPLDMADLRLAVELGDFGLANFPVIGANITNSYHEGEAENWSDYTWVPGKEHLAKTKSRSNEVNGAAVRDLPNGFGHGHAQATNHDAMDVDMDDIVWEGAAMDDQNALDALLDSCLAI
jgi:transcriptional coactivator HFI1/ADA1